jgi:hypothetical protein
MRAMQCGDRRVSERTPDNNQVRYGPSARQLKYEEDLAIQ